MVLDPQNQQCDMAISYIRVGNSMFNYLGLKGPNTQHSGYMGQRINGRSLVRAIGEVLCMKFS